MAAPERFVWLDLVRGASALAVCAGHLRLVTLHAYRDLPDPNPFQTLFYVATGLASPAVMVFFVLSGMLVGGSVFRAGPRFRFRDYLVARLTRLWVVLLPALLVTLVVDSFTLRLAPGVADGAFYGRWTSGPEPGTYSTSLPTFLGNAAFLNTILVPSYGTNGPLWTLACEFWYYVTFPLLGVAAGVVGPRRGWLPRAAALAAAVAAVACMPRLMAGGFVVWLMGVAAGAAGARLPGPARPLPTAAALAGFVLALAYSKLDHYGFAEPVPARYVVGLAFAGLAVQLVRLPPPGRLLRAAAGFTSDISYSLYLVHFPLTVYLGVRWYAGGELAPTPAALVMYAGWFAGLVAAGWVFWLVFERHTPAVREWVGRAVGRHRDQPPQRDPRSHDTAEVGTG